MFDETSTTSTAAENSAAAPEVQAESAPAQSAPPAQPEAQAAPAATEPPAIELTGHQVAYLASHGYTTDPVGFVTRMSPADRESFFNGAAAWVEGQPEADKDEPAAEPVKQGPIVTGVVHKAP